MIALQGEINSQLAEARESVEHQMWSALIHDEAQLFDIEELKLRLGEKLQETTKRIAEQQAAYGSSKVLARC